MFRVSKHVKIYAGVDLRLVLPILEDYLKSPNAKAIGLDSLIVYSDGVDPDVSVYATATCYVIRGGKYE